MSRGPWHALDCVSHWMEQPTLLLPPCACLAVLITAGRPETPQADGTRQPEAHQGKFIWYSSTLFRGVGSNSESSPGEDHTTVSSESPPGHVSPVHTGKGGIETGLLHSTWERSGRYQKLPAGADKGRTYRKLLHWAPTT